ncbi:MAG: hypothetical protein FWC61_00505, partial [Proteobacteria bacterium]|nr:hypothetical protein [Pseudomonadota bacterium]
FDGPLDGVSYTGIGGAYRVRDDSIVTDFLAGVKFGGHAATPEYEDVVYSVGARMGKQWSWLTIAATLQSSWIFHDTHGLAYIDLSPEVYMRVFSSWRLGAYGMLRKATNPDLDAEAMGGKVAAIYGRTMYVGFAQYEFSHSELRFGGRINILF